MASTKTIKKKKIPAFDSATYWDGLKPGDTIYNREKGHKIGTVLFHGNVKGFREREILLVSSSGMLNADFRRSFKYAYTSDKEYSIEWPPRVKGTFLQEIYSVNYHSDRIKAMIALIDWSATEITDEERLLYKLGKMCT